MTDGIRRRGGVRHEEAPRPENQGTFFGRTWNKLSSYWSASSTTQKVVYVSLAACSVALLYNKYFNSDAVEEEQDPEDPCERDLAHAMSQILECPFSRKLYEGMLAEGRLKGIVCPNNLVDQTDYIKLDGSKENLLSDLIAEMVNYGQDLGDLYVENVQKRCSFANADEFARSIGEVFHKIFSRKKAVIEGCMNGGFWPLKYDEVVAGFNNPDPKESWKSFDVFYSGWSRSGLTTQYEQVWSRDCLDKKIAEMTQKFGTGGTF